jgi:adenine-specific DNA-methyltransferase
MLIRANIQRLPLPANSVDLIFTDPPYLREYLSCYRWLAQEAKRVLKPGGFVLAMCGGLYLNQIFRFFDEARLTFYWKYEMFMPGPQKRVWPGGRSNNQIHIQVNTRSILAYSKGPALACASTQAMFRNGGRDKRYHPWGQDELSARYCISSFSRPRDLVLDPFVGGGTTAVACEQLGRRWICGDLDPRALDTTSQRLRLQ